jgi:hypothetical protein
MTFLKSWLSKVLNNNHLYLRQLVIFTFINQGWNPYYGNGELT